MSEAKPKKPAFDPEYILDISEAVYRLELERECPTNTERMLAKDNDGGKKLRNRAKFYNSLTRSYQRLEQGQQSAHRHPDADCWHSGHGRLHRGLRPAGQPELFLQLLRHGRRDGGNRRGD